MGARERAPLVADAVALQGLVQTELTRVARILGAAGEEEQAQARVGDFSGRR